MLLVERVAFGETREEPADRLAGRIGLAPGERLGSVAELREGA
jgi:hypothetical protein